MDAIKEERQCVRNRTSAFGVLTRGFSEGLHELVALDAEFLEEFGIFRGSAQEVFDGDEVVFEAFGFVFGAGEDVVESLRDVDLVGGSGDVTLGRRSSSCSRRARRFSTFTPARLTIDGARPPPCARRAASRCSTSTC
jgi:hypothetical protein